VGTKYQTIHLNTTFPPSFLDPLLRMSLAADAEMRLLVQKIFHTLIDRHRNIMKLAKPTVNMVELGLVIEKASRPDVIFIRKHGPEIYLALYESLELSSNTVENVESIYTTLALLAIELASEETVLELLRLVLSLQDLALTSGQISLSLKFNLHATVISLLVLISYVCNITVLMDYAKKVVDARRKDSPHLLPDLQSQYDTSLTSRLTPALLVDQTVVSECLKGAGFDSGKLQQGSGYSSNSLQHRHSWVDSAGRNSLADINSGGPELDSGSSSPNVQKKLPGEELTFESMKRILTENNNNQVVEEEKRMQLFQFFRNAPFQDLVSKTQPKELATPKADVPDHGYIVPNVELSPLCSSKFRPGPPSEQAQVLSKSIDIVLSNSRALDLKDLCICKNKLVWVLYCDILCLNYNGSVVDACIGAVIAALKTLTLPEVNYNKETGVIVVYPKNRKAFTVRTLPVSASFAIFEKQLLLADPSDDEEDMSSARFSIVMDDEEEICYIYKPGGIAISQNLFCKALEMTKMRAKSVRSVINAAISTLNMNNIED
ncbi:protein efr3-like protein cmp44e protein, partial [Lasius niger]